MTDQPVPTTTAQEDDDRRRKALWLWLAVVAVLLAGLLVAIERLNGCSGEVCGAGARAGGLPSTSVEGGTGARAVKATTHHNADSSSVSIRVSGSDPSALAPGVTSPVVVTVVNTGSAAAHVTTASVKVGDASSDCTAAKTIRTTAYVASAANAAQYVIAPHHVAHIPLAISMLDLATNQNACKNARFPLTFRATAQQG